MRLPFLKRAIKSGRSRVLVDVLSSHAAVGLGKNLFPLFARALDLSPDFFDDKVRIHPLADPISSQTIGNSSNDDDST